MTFASNSLWDFQLPADSLTSVPDDDFLAILQGQLVSGHGPALDRNPLFINNHNLLHQDIPLSANPKSISRVQDAQTNPSPLTDSSPSPPSGQDANADHYDDQRHANRRRVSTGDDFLKRKASHGDDEEDEDDHLPPAQRSHIGDKQHSKSSKRKSGGNVNPDDNRLLKRKEQNRAAQRAFRERKEKHVKDLEDQLAVMEAKNDTTQSENDSLKEMLRRLQTENTLLKQAAFTFSVPRPSSSSKSPPVQASTSSSQFENRQYQAKQAMKEPNGSGSSSQTSPGSIFDDNFVEAPTYSTPSSAAANSPSTSLMGERSLKGDVNAPGANPSYNFNSDWITPTASQQPPQSPFTIISSNPTYMSYRDPSPSSNPYASFSAMSSPQQPYPVMNSSAPMTPFYHPQYAQQSFLSPDIMMNDFTGNAPSNDIGSFTFSPISNSNDLSTLDDLFGGQFSQNNVTNTYPAYSVGASPISPPAHSGNPSPSPQSASTSSQGTCTKQQIAEAVASQGLSTFVDNRTRQLVFETGGVRFSGAALESTEKSPSNVDVNTAFNSLQGHPKFKDCDINTLCTEFAAKARCDGERAVISSDNVQAMMDCISRKAQGLEQSG